MDRSEQWGVVQDENADRRSLMYQAPCVCSGEANGVQCKHYWYAFQQFPSANADAVRDGDKRRNCTVAPSFMLEFTDKEKPTRCNRYEPRLASGLVAIVKRTAARIAGLAPRAGASNGGWVVTWGFVGLDHRFEDFRPLTAADVKKLRETFPDLPKVLGAGKRLDQLSIQDIIDGPQIGILRPGEKVPEGLSDETSSAVDGIFGGSDSSIFKKK
jgi:hypothetical protein